MQHSCLASYQNGGYQVSIFADGTKVRETLDASVPPVLPEQMDLKITGWCDAGCAWCHEQSTPKGKHGDVDAILRILKPLNPGTEVAIGGGDPLSHPEFERLVRTMSEQGLVPNVTVNGVHFAKHRDTLEKLIGLNSIYGVGVSYAGELPEWDYPHMVVHLITGIHSPEVLDAAQRSYKLLLLGYKKFGRGKKLHEIRSSEIDERLRQWYRELFWVAREHHLSFDNLAIEQLKPERLFSDPAVYSSRYMGAEGQFSMYLDGVEQTYGLSSYSSHRAGWTNMPEMFADIRQQAGFLPALQ